MNPLYGFIQQHCYKPSPDFYDGEFPTMLPKHGIPYLGVELEVTFPRYCWDTRGDGTATKAPFMHMADLVEDLGKWKEWYWKTDASLAERGLEIVTHPMTLNYHKAFWSKALPRLQAKEINRVPDIKKLGSCHIHISRSFFTPAEERRLYLFTQHNSLRVETLARRKANHWCRIGRRGPLAYQNCNRGEAVNYSNKNTIEFRSFDTTVEAAVLLGTLEYVRALAGFVKTVNGLQIIGGRSWPLFLDYCQEGGYKSFLSYWEGIKDTPPADREAAFAKK